MVHALLWRMVLMTIFHAMVKNYVNYLKKAIIIEKLLVNF
jgi:hypothetical protein